MSRPMVFLFGLIERGVDSVKILGVKMVLCDAEGIGETIRVKYFMHFRNNY